MLLSAFLHAGWNALLRVEPDKDRGLVAAIIAGSIFAGLISVARWARGDVPFATLASFNYTLLAGAFEAVYFVTLARALERGKLGPVYTISRGGAVLMGLVCGGSFLILMEALTRGGSGYVLTLRNTSVLFAAGLAFAIGEKPSRGELVGAALVAAGAVLMAW